MSEKSTLPVNPLPLKERMKIARTHMPELDARVRSHNFEEVNQGLEAADALTEATRCIACAKPGCVVDCPVGVKIKEVVALIHYGDFLGAAAKLREDNSLPAITGRVCPQENQCEGGCVLGKKGSPVAIGNLERFVADFERNSGQLGLPGNAPATGKSVAIVGSGPAGLSAAGDLIQKGQISARHVLVTLGGQLRSIGQGGLVTMVPVGDDNPRVAHRLADRIDRGGAADHPQFVKHAIIIGGGHLGRAGRDDGDEGLGQTRRE